MRDAVSALFTLSLKRSTSQNSETNVGVHGCSEGITKESENTSWARISPLTGFYSAAVFSLRLDKQNQVVERDVGVTMAHCLSPLQRKRRSQPPGLILLSIRWVPVL